MRKTKLLPRLRAKRLHKIGRHGAVGLLVTESLICAECNKPIENERNDFAEQLNNAIKRTIIKHFNEPTDNEIIKKLRKLV